MTGESATWSDLVLVVSANLVNVLLAALFVARGRGALAAEHWLGLATVVLAAPVACGIVGNVLQARGAWMVILPVCLLAYLLLELMLDYWLGVDFRSTWLVGPYILIFYAGLMAMIGYGFLVDRVYGFLTLATYFLCLGATWWGHAR